MKCFRSAGKCFPGYNEHEFQVKHRNVIPANHNSGKLNQKRKTDRRRRKGKIASALCADFKCLKNKRGNVPFILMWVGNNNKRIEFRNSICAI